MITMKKRLPSEYIEFIEKCKMKQYKDKNIHKHHILPRFMGGVDEPNNLIELSVTDHFEAHRILAENIDGGYKRGAYASLNLLKRFWSGDYNEIRDEISKSVSGTNNGMNGKNELKNINKW